MNAILKFTTLIMLTIVCGVGVVTWETPQNLLLFAIWSAVALIGVRRLRPSIGGKAAFATGVAHAAVMAIIITIAILAPFKRNAVQCSFVVPPSGGSSCDIPCKFRLKAGLQTGDCSILERYCR